MKYLIDKTTKKVKSYGYIDFENHPNFDSDTEEVIETTSHNLNIHQNDSYWNSSTGKFQESPIE